MMREERGAVMVIVGAVLMGMIFLAALVVDRANQFEHKRHLQLQVDAAALAGADSISLPLTDCSNTAINAMAHNYGGRDANHATSLYNSQVGGTPDAKMHILVNSLSYWTSTDPNAIDNSGGAPCDTANNTFCPGSVGVDIKGTESDLPWLLGLGLVKTTINAHSRVCLMQQTTSANSLPVAVPNPHPRTAAAIFADKNTCGSSCPLIQVGSSPATYAVPLTECTNPAPPAPPTCPTLSTWTSAAATVNIRPTTAVYIALSGLTNLDLTQSTLAGICGQPLTSCFDAASDPPAAAVSFIRGWTNSGSPPPNDNPPRLRDVQLFPDTTSGGTPCTATPGNAYFEVITSNCSVRLEAKIDIGTLDKNQTSFIAAGANCPNQGCPLTKDIGVPTSPECVAVSANGASGECWSASIPVKVADGAANPITIGWNVHQGTVAGKDCTKGQGCSGTFTNSDGSTTVQQAYTGNNNPSITKTNSGPLKLVQILGCSAGGGCTTANANSLPVGNNSIAVTIQIEGALRNATGPNDTNASCTFTDGSTHNFACLKVVVATGGSGSTQSVDCDPFSATNNKLEDQIANGCVPQYKINTGAAGPWTPCPSKTNLDDPLNNHTGDNNHPQPWRCVSLFTGNKVTAIGNGLNRRIMGGDPPPAGCPPYGQRGHNNWAMYDPNAANDGNPNQNDGFPDNDPRIVGVYLTAYGAFTHTSGTSVTIPVTDFATFYVTGYDQSPCASVLDHPDDPIPDKGTVVGHFIKYVSRLNSGGGTVACDPNGFGACVPVMTK